MMSEKAKTHYDRYAENVAAAAKIEDLLPDYGSWICVIRFYAALHLINAYLVDKPNIHFNPASTEHKERKAAMSRCPELRDAPEKYRDLKDLSEAFRYRVDFVFIEEHRQSSAAWLRKIVAIVEPKLMKG